MWKDFDKNIVVIFQTAILRFVGFYVRRSARVLGLHYSYILKQLSYQISTLQLSNVLTKQPNKLC